MAAAGHLPLYLSSYVEQDRTEYGQALQEAQKQLSYNRIVAFVADAIVGAHEEEKVSKAIIAALPQTWHSRGRFRKGSSAERALSIITKMPIITAGLLADELGVPFQAASNTLNILTKQQIVRERTGHGRNRIFASEDVIAVLARPFAEDPEIALEGARHSLDA